MHVEKPALAPIMRDPTLKGYSRVVKLFFTPTEAGRTAGDAFAGRLARLEEDLDRPSGPEVATSQIAAFREWERPAGERFADLRTIRQPTLVVNGVRDELIPVSGSYRLVENLPNAALLVYPDAGHGSLFQYNESFVRQATAFLASDSSTEGW